MKSYTTETQNALTSLSHSLYSHMSALESTLNKGANRKLHIARTPKLRTRKSKNTLKNQLINDVVKGVGKFTTGSSNAFQSINRTHSSSGQTWADIANAIQKAITRDL